MWHKYWVDHNIWNYSGISSWYHNRYHSSVHLLRMEIMLPTVNKSRCLYLLPSHIHIMNSQEELSTNCYEHTELTAVSASNFWYLEEILCEKIPPQQNIGTVPQNWWKYCIIHFFQSSWSTTYIAQRRNVSGNGEEASGATNEWFKPTAHGNRSCCPAEAHFAAFT